MILFSLFQKSIEFQTILKDIIFLRIAMKILKNHNFIF